VVLLWFAVGACLGPTPKKKKNEKEEKEGASHTIWWMLLRLRDVLLNGKKQKNWVARNRRSRSIN
jgi:hypothetical protein